MLFLDEVLVSGKDRKEELIAENNLEWGDHEWIQFKLRLINYGFPLWKDFEIVESSGLHWWINVEEAWNSF